jgi:hypothetical protein
LVAGISTGDLASKRGAGDILAITPTGGGVRATGTAVFVQITVHFLGGGSVF